MEFYQTFFFFFTRQIICTSKRPFPGYSLCRVRVDFVTLYSIGVNDHIDTSCQYIGVNLFKKKEWRNEVCLDPEPRISLPNKVVQEREIQIIGFYILL